MKTLNAACDLAAELAREIIRLREAIEKAWREGYAAGYRQGQGDECSYQSGGQRGIGTEDSAWNESDTKQSLSIVRISDAREKI